MSNERLRAAIETAGLELEQLAEIVEVDAKTVERWIAGRVPYTRHRIRVAKALGADIHELWPETQPAAGPAAEKLGEELDQLVVYATGEAPRVPDWQVLLTGARERIDLLDPSLLEVVSVPGVIELLAAKAAAGCEIRILLANPDGDWVLRLDGITSPTEFPASAELAEEIEETRGHLAPLLGTRGVQIREYLEADPGSILRFDEHLLFSPPLWLTDRTEAPLLHIIRRQPGGLFDRLAGHFDAIWAYVSEPVEENWTEQWAERERAAPAPAQPAADADSTGSLLSAGEHAQLTATLRGWGVEAETIADTLNHAMFVPGVTGIQSADPAVGPGVAIMIDVQRDPKIQTLFRIRAERDDDAFLADWKIDGTHTRVLPAADAPEALIAYTIFVSRPIPVTRTFLILASKGGQPLAWLARPGTSVWLIPHEFAMREWAKEGAGPGRDIYHRMLPLGEVLEPSLAIEAALMHVAHQDV